MESHAIVIARGRCCNKFVSAAFDFARGAAQDCHIGDSVQIVGYGKA
jgi:hypothetical protein